MDAVDWTGEDGSNSAGDSVEGTTARWARCAPICEAKVGPDQMSLVRTVLDFAANSLPMRLVRVVPLKDHLEAEALCRVADLLLAEHVDTAVDVLARTVGSIFSMPMKYCS